MMLNDLVLGKFYSDLLKNIEWLYSFKDHFFYTIKKEGLYLVVEFEYNNDRYKIEREIWYDNRCIITGKTKTIHDEEYSLSIQKGRSLRSVTIPGYRVKKIPIGFDKYLNKIFTDINKHYATN